MGTRDEVIFSEQMLNANLRTLEPYPGSNAPWQCECLECGSIVSPRYYTVVKQGKSGCKFCAARAAARTRSSSAGLAAISQAVSMKLTPQGPYPGAHSKWTLTCNSCGLLFEKVAQAISQGKGCPDCSANARLRITKDANSIRAHEAFEIARLRPLGEFSSMTQPWPSQCLICGSLCSPRPSAVIYSGVGCRQCSSRRSAHKRRVNENEARLEMIDAGILPDAEMPYPGIAKAWQGICLKCGLPTNCSLGNVRRGHSGCRRCSMLDSDSAFDFFGPAIFYMISMPHLAIGKVGIAGTQTKRIQAHRREGWTVDSVIELDHGFDAWYLEGAVLSWLRGELGLASVMSAEEMPQGGFTETFSTKHLTMDEVAAKSTQILENKTWLAPEAFLEGTAKSKPRRRCSLSISDEQCSITYYSNGYCRKHYSAWKAHGNPLHIVREKYANKTCLVVEDGSPCGSEVNRKGMCSVHYQRDYEYGDPLHMKRPTPQPLPSSCKSNGCLGKPYSLGFCQRHYHAFRRSNKASRSTEN